MATGKRQFRDMEDDVKQKISQSLKNRENLRNTLKKFRIR